MPTAAKLAAAVAFAFMAFMASEFYKPLLPEGTQVGLLSVINAIVGMLAGWFVAGRFAGKGYYAAAGTGVRTMAVALFYVLLIWSGYEMIKRSTKLRYDGPVEALQAMMDLVAEYFMLMLTDPQIPIVLVLGGMLAACFSEWTSKRFA